MNFKEEYKKQNENIIPSEAKLNKIHMQITLTGINNKRTIPYRYLLLVAVVSIILTSSIITTFFLCNRNESLNSVGEFIFLYSETSSKKTNSITSDVLNNTNSDESNEIIPDESDAINSHESDISQPKDTVSKSSNISKESDCSEIETINPSTAPETSMNDESKESEVSKEPDIYIPPKDTDVYIPKINSSNVDRIVNWQIDNTLGIFNPQYPAYTVYNIDNTYKYIIEKGYHVFIPVNNSAILQKAEFFTENRLIRFTYIYKGNTIVFDCTELGSQNEAAQAVNTFLSYAKNKNTVYIDDIEENAVNIQSDNEYSYIAFTKENTYILISFKNSVFTHIDGFEYKNLMEE